MPRFAANISWLFTERPLLARAAAAAEAGFSGVESLFPYDAAAEDLRAALDAAGLPLVLINAPPGDWAAGERGLAALPGAEARFEAALETALATADALGAGRIHIMAGIAEGAAARATYVANLRRACASAPERLFAIEPINSRDMPGYHLSRTEDALRVIEAVGAPNLSLQLDLYHLQIMEGDLTRRIEALGSAIGHVQIAGVPDRAEPDRGETRLDWLMAELDRIGYAGWVGAEYRPAARTEDGLGWLAPYSAGRGAA
ncbi:MAG: hydroxypyruvate isomerase family protein [Rubrimonas sp.]|uniref:hydroxypyruvate isomerase family protein n=1 Tax=Rubrimonas sp. TaxID=2036015 RepID=UPI002FDE315F